MKVRVQVALSALAMGVAHALAVEVVLAASAAVSQNWPSFRGPNASGVATG